MNRSSKRIGGFFLLAGAILMAGCGADSESDAQHENAASSGPVQITIGYVDWAEAVAVSQLVKNLLEQHFDYEVRLEQANIETVFQQVADGETDAFLDVWLPTTHENYWRQYQNDLVDLGPWYEEDATLGLAVPDYVPIRSMADLKGSAEQFDGEIVGIESGAGLTRIVQDKAISAYGLDAYTLVTSGTPEMIAALDEAVSARRPIVVTAWKPHWIFNAYPLRYLDDPENAMGKPDRIHAVVRKGLEEDAPAAYKLMDALSLSEQQLGSLELAIEDARSPYGGVQRWLDAHDDLVRPWVRAAREKVERELY